MERKLAAILAADVVGYSALMEADEAGTFDQLRAGRTELFEPEIKKHHGRIFKLMGDGLLAEFGSVVEAVECAVSLQMFPNSPLLTVQLGWSTWLKVGLFYSSDPQADLQEADRLVNQVLSDKDLSPQVARLAHWLRAWL